jgi:radical SAM protein with 4Fe4S-binding SPASM domain
MPRPQLQTLIFEITQACDHACTHCYNYWRHPDHQGAGRLESERADLRPLLTHVLDQVDCDLITLTGGEPLLRPDLPDILSFLSERDVRINLITNGHRLSEERTTELIRLGVGLFELPLLSFRRETHDALSGRQGAFDAVLAALAHIRYHRGQAVAVFVITRRNVADLRDTLKLASAFGVRGVMLNRFNAGGRGATAIDELLPSVDEMRNALEVAEAASHAYRLPISCSIPIQPCLIDTSHYPHLGFGFCGAGSKRAYYTLDTDGNVRPCNHTPTILGNAWHEPFADIVASARLANFVAAIPSFCAPCTVRDECQGGCKASAQVCYGDLNGEEPFLHKNLGQAQPIACLSRPEIRSGSDKKRPR